MSVKRFRVAFSFGGEVRDFVEKVAGILAERFTRDAILYDKYHEAEFAVYDLGIKLPKLYGEQSDLIVPVLCPNYDTKRWTGWEWVHIYSLLTKADGHRVMQGRFDRANADGLSPAAGFIELDEVDRLPRTQDNRKHRAIFLADLADAELFDAELDAKSADAKPAHAKLRSANENYKRALKITTAEYLDEGTATYTGGRADVALARNDWPAAEKRAREALTLSEKIRVRRTHRV